MVPFIVFDQLLSFTLEPVVQKLDLFKFKILIKLENVKIEILSIFGADWNIQGRLTGQYGPIFPGFLGFRPSE